MPSPVSMTLMLLSQTTEPLRWLTLSHPADLPLTSPPLWTNPSRWLTSLSRSPLQWPTANLPRRLPPTNSRPLALPRRASPTVGVRDVKVPPSTSCRQSSAANGITAGSTVTHRSPQPGMPPPQARLPTSGWQSRMTGGRQDQLTQPMLSQKEQRRKRAHSAPGNDSGWCATPRQGFP